VARSVLQCWSVTSDFYNNDLFDVSGFSTVCCYVTDVAGVLLWKQNALHISLFCCQLSFVDDIFKCLQFGSFSCGFIRNSRFSLLNSIQFFTGAL
jgi:SUMO ligase MMS21 Smc5/6 complex component